MKNLLFTILAFSSSFTFAQGIGINLANMDKSANPANDFYTYANGTWQKTFKMSETDARYGSFNEINNNNLKNIKGILKAAAVNKTAAANTDDQRLRDFYNTAMDSTKANKLGFTPIASPEKNIVTPILSKFDLRINNCLRFFTLSISANREAIGVKPNLFALVESIAVL